MLFIQAGKFADGVTEIPVPPFIAKYIGYDPTITDLTIPLVPFFLKNLNL